jgi:hypothetical protein
MEIYLLQRFYDRVTEHFINGIIDKRMYLKISEILENQKIFFTINLN